MQIWIESSAKQTFRNARPGKYARSRRELHTAKNSHISAQIIMRGINPFEINAVRITDTENVRIFYQKYRMFSDGITYPDEIAEITQNSGVLPQSVPAHAAQGIWVDFYIPQNEKQKSRSYKITVSTSDGEFDAYITLIIHNVTLPSCAEGTFSHEYFFSIYNMPGFGEADMYKEKWWDAVKRTAGIFREMRNNVIAVPLLQLLRHAGSRRSGSGAWHYDWSLFDRFTDIFMASDSVKAFTVSAFIESVNGRKTESIGENSESISIDVPSEEGEMFIASLYSALSKHINDRNLTGMFRAHIEDEPHTDTTWRWARDIIRKAAPEIPCGEPLDMLETSKALAEYADLFIPRIDVYAQDPGFFSSRCRDGRELWVYSCCYPEEGWWLNKFIDMPFIRSRLMEWACKANNISGFLHWGFNYWNANPIYGVGPEARFKGDGNAVYPNDEGGCFNLSTRFINTRDGNQDAELIEICMGKAPGETLRIVRSVCGDFENYSEDAELLLAAVQRLLEIAEG